MNLDLWKQRKKELHLNYGEIAKSAGVSKRTVEDIFRGFTPTPRIDTVQAIEKALGITDSGLWTAEDYSDGDIFSLKKISVTPIEDELLYKFKEIGNCVGEKGQTLLLEFADIILNVLKK
jgi:transcriptional regulator with XRE-family HTH domain